VNFKVNVTVAPAAVEPSAVNTFPTTSPNPGKSTVSPTLAMAAGGVTLSSLDRAVGFDINGPLY
jgi:hypothetical protein